MKRRSMAGLMHGDGPKTCAHPDLKTWYGGGTRKARCEMCWAYGLEQRLMRERYARCHHRKARGYPSCCYCGKFLTVNPKGEK